MVAGVYAVWEALLPTLNGAVGVMRKLTPNAVWRETVCNGQQELQNRTKLMVSRVATRGLIIVRWVVTTEYVI